MPELRVKPERHAVQGITGYFIRHWLVAIRHLYLRSNL